MWYVILVSLSEDASRTKTQNVTIWITLGLFSLSMYLTNLFIFKNIIWNFPPV